MLKKPVFNVKLKLLIILILILIIDFLSFINTFSEAAVYRCSLK